MFNLQLVFGNKYLEQNSTEENREENLLVVSPECETCPSDSYTPGALAECGDMKD